MPSLPTRPQRATQLERRAEVLPCDNAFHIRQQLLRAKYRKLMMDLRKAHEAHMQHHDKALAELEHERQEVEDAARRVGTDFTLHVAGDDGVDRALTAPDEQLVCINARRTWVQSLIATQQRTKALTKKLDKALQGFYTCCYNGDLRGSNEWREKLVVRLHANMENLDTQMESAEADGVDVCFQELGRENSESEASVKATHNKEGAYSKLSASFAETLKNADQVRAKVTWWKEPKTLGSGVPQSRAA